MTKFQVSFDGIMDSLEELERENHRLQAENAAMRLVVEAVAKAEAVTFADDVFEFLRGVTLLKLSYLDMDAKAWRDEARRVLAP